MFEVAEGYEVTMGRGAGSWRLCFWSLSVSAMVTERRGVWHWGPLVDAREHDARGKNCRHRSVGGFHSSGSESNHRSSCDHRIGRRAKPGLCGCIF